MKELYIISEERDKAIGIINKKYSDIDTSKTGGVRSDVTRNCKLSRVATSKTILEYVEGYYKNDSVVIKKFMR